MEIKKSNKANNENLRFSIALMALLFLGGFVLASFTYQTSLEADLLTVLEANSTEIEYTLEETPVKEPETMVDPEVTTPLTPEIIIVPPKTDPPKTVIKLTPPNPPKVNPDPPVIAPEPIDFPDVEAMFPGGAAELQKWIFANVEYPEASIEIEDQGRVFLSFIVEADGSITGVKVTKSASKELDREAQRVTRKMPNWTPGEVAGKRVRTRCRLPIVFTLE
ncbi:TonB family protein [Crocinitomicaceae bacterium]|nr:TonB family protein [Crocinitomicaceae bacterium]MDC0099057.1 TonB family protein [Crocinitomicaceae bacterium]MDC1196214.1 TonB family protein [Crocinitomicaceae bacterium]MDC1282722.1 TonB family protein [Crocinitomicaceae bacterium]|tara:strand:- start:49 stop:711 length:663 start_codon:yes stop_codon:yes gene_type:complete